MNKHQAKNHLFLNNTDYPWEKGENMKHDKENTKTDMENEIPENTEPPVAPEEQEEKNKSARGGNRRLRNAVVRMASALIVPAILLAITGFAPITLLKGPKETEAIQNDEIGDFVVHDIYCILGFYADQKNKADETTGRYAVVPMNGELVSVYFTQRYLESANSVCDNTYNFINGKAAALDKYVIVEGTVEEIGEDVASLMYDWFGINKNQLVQMRMIADTDDYSDYLSDSLLVVDTVNSYSETVIYIIGIISALLLLYSIIEIILMSTGFYLSRRSKKQCCEYTEFDGGDSDTEANNDGKDESGQQETEPRNPEDSKPEDEE